MGEEALLVGAFIVNPPGAAEPDRVFVIMEWQKFNPSGEDTILAINGKSWPATERLDYQAGEPVHWRIINASSETHAMHLHGFFFTVEGVGDPAHFLQFPLSERREVVTEGIVPGHAFNMTWKPQRVGNWLFHCHMVSHMSPLLTLHPPETKIGPAAEGHDHSEAMGGLVMGITVSQGTTSQPVPFESKDARKLQLVISDNPQKIPFYKVDVNDPSAPKKLEANEQPSLLGPPLILTRGEPVEIEVVNHSTTPTAIHWHGIEVESYYDGVPGWSGSEKHLAPPIVPGSSFIARITPPRAGTFIYHTHWHDQMQIRNGLYGALIVVEPGKKIDPDLDRVFVFSIGKYAPLGFMMLINGQPGPDPLPLHAGIHYRFRLINITDEGSDLRVRLLSKEEQPVSWRVMAKDGADLPPNQIFNSPADMTLPVGTTSDVEVTPNTPGPLNLQISSDTLQAIAMHPFVVTQ